jgi:elongation factor P
MVNASEFRPGVALRLEGALYKVLDASYHAGQGKMGGVAHVKLRNLATGTLREWRFRADEALDDVAPEHQSARYLYGDGELSHFMNPDTFEQFAVDNQRIGAALRYLREDMTLQV